ncbi:MAG: chorismate synthase [Myxococcota bacterium]|nr:chorismate synthase [Myxococcota bacterium]MDW8362568.1 chorismate synthase [Myxococcales bacterium]
MSGSSFGKAFVVTSAGESHGLGYVVVVDGCPPGVPLDVEQLRAELRRRRPGQSRLVSRRDEPDEPEILSGVVDGHTTGTPVAILVRNVDARPRDYDELVDVYRPGHADFSYEAKYGVRDVRGGGRASGRETLTRVAAGVLARNLLAQACGTRIVGWVERVGDVVAELTDPTRVERDDVERTATRCPDPAAASRMEALIERMRKQGDSIGGVAVVCAQPVPAGLGEPVFDGLDARLAHALFSIPAVVGVEKGSGFAAARMRGSEHNDPFVRDGTGTVRTATNHHGGVLGGISTGMPIVVRLAVKPPSSIARAQRTLRRDRTETELRVRGRHDPCLLPRVVPVAEAMVALVLADALLLQRRMASSSGSG